MAKYRIKSVVIDAMQWTGLESYLEIVDWMKRSGATALMVMQILEGAMAANPGDWIIRGVKNEFYPCKPDIFEATYEPAE